MIGPLIVLFVVGTLMVIVGMALGTRDRSSSAADGRLRGTLPMDAKQPPMDVPVGTRAMDRSRATRVTTGANTTTWVPKSATMGAPTSYAAAGQQSLDALFAADRQLWVCAYCETLNERTRRTCVACGHNRT